jgi:TolB-like protein/DNA-binding winged helix-turn-helix (wHTH) protein/thioredoxin-like negative regulator of GroEL
MQPAQAPRIYEFGDFVLDALRRVLMSRAGEPVEISGRVIEALVYLVERPGQLVEKRELIEALWPHVVVEDGNLTQAIHTLRRALGERAGEHRYISTVPGRGYRFVAEVNVRTGEGPVAATPAQLLPQSPVLPPGSPPATVVPEVQSAPRRSKQVLVWAASAIALLIVVGVLGWRGRDLPVEEPAVAAQPSIAVLPFVDMSAEQDQVHFAEGLSEEILNLLARADELRVIARTSSFSFKDQNADIRTIARRLSVSHVLEGSVRKSGERVRITAQLIDGANSAHVWSDTFDRDVSDIFGVQREIASAVAGALHVSLRPAGPRRAETSSAEAYEHFLQGRHLYNRRSDEDFQKAKTHFEMAVKIDPAYGRAWAGLAGIYMVARYEDVDLPDEMQNWREAVERAVALAPDLAEAHIRAAQYQSHVGNKSLAYEHFDRAVALDPENPLVLGTRLSKAMHQGRMEDALEMQRRVVLADPLSATNRGNLGYLLMMMGRLPEAQAELERALELSPDGTSVREAVADVLIMQGRADEAIKVAARIPEGHSRDQRFALAYFAQGSVSEGDAMLSRLITQAKKPHADTEVAVGVAVAVAEVYAARKDADRAFEWLNEARLRTQDASDDSPGWMLHDNLQMAPYLKPLHADPRWDELLAMLTKEENE